jgi:hypothetical protein
MALVVNSTRQGGSQPSAPIMAGRLDASPDSSYPAGGYSVKANLPNGVEVIHSPYVPHYDGATLRWFRIVDVTGTPTLKCYANGSGAPAAEVAPATDLSGHDNVVVLWIGE